MPKYLCSHAGCRNISDRNFCEKHRDRSKDKKVNPKQPPSNKSTTKNNDIYFTSRWRKLRNLKIVADPLCAECLRYEIVTPATCVDHIIEINDAPELAFEYSNLQSLCSACHNRKTAKEKQRRIKEINTLDIKRIIGGLNGNSTI